MSFYSLLVVLHVLAAVVGMGPAFAFPIMSKMARNKSQLLLMNQLMAKVEKVVKIGSITLLLTGLLMGILHTYLFTSGWYLTSIALYIIAQIFVIGVSAPKMKQSAVILEKSTTEEIPGNVLALNQKANTALQISSGIAVVMVILMSVKPF